MLTEQQTLECEGQDALCTMVQEGLEDREADRIVHALTGELGRTPTAEEVVVRHLYAASERYAAGQQWGLFRNTRFHFGESCVRRMLPRDALLFYLEVCLIDANGPRNCASSDPQHLRKYPPFKASSANLASGVLDRVATIQQALNLSISDVEQLFEEVANRVQGRVKLPRKTSAVWREVAKGLSNDGPNRS